VPRHILLKIAVAVYSLAFMNATYTAHLMLFLGMVMKAIDNNEFAGPCALLCVSLLF